MKLQPSKRQHEQDAQRRLVREAIGLVRSGQSVAEVAEKTGLHRLTVERGLREAIDRQAVIRTHLQSRSGLTSLVRYPDRGPGDRPDTWGTVRGS